MKVSYHDQSRKSFLRLPSSRSRFPSKCAHSSKRALRRRVTVTPSSRTSPRAKLHNGGGVRNASKGASEYSAKLMEMTKANTTARLDFAAGTDRRRKRRPRGRWSCVTYSLARSSSRRSPPTARNLPNCPRKSRPRPPSRSRPTRRSCSSRRSDQSFVYLRKAQTEPGLSHLKVGQSEQRRQTLLGYRRKPTSLDLHQRRSRSRRAGVFRFPHLFLSGVWYCPYLPLVS